MPKGYHSGGASYVLSREALRRFYQAHQNPKLRCRKDGGNEDVEVARCLRKVGVYPGKSLDKQNRELFHPLPFDSHFRGEFPDWLALYAENRPQKVTLYRPHSLEMIKICFYFLVELRLLRKSNNIFPLREPQRAIHDRFSGL